MAGADHKAVFTVATIFLTILICWSPLCAHGLVTHPEEVSALFGVRSKIKDSFKNLNWTKKHDPCTSNWTGILCFFDQNDGYLHVQELRLLRLNLSGTLAPDLGKLRYLKRLDFMWNSMSGSIPKEVGNITALENLLLSGNQISGSLPDELGFLPNLNKFQLDLNFISGPIPKTFGNLPKVQHFHMNDNRFSGQLPPELSALPLLRHFLLDNNNLSGYLPPELSQMPSLTIFQLDNNNFAGSTIPQSYSNMTKLRKLSLRNCNLQGTIPDLSRMRNLLYLDLSINQLTGVMPSNRLGDNITTIDLSYNKLNGSIPSNFSGFSRLQRLHLNDNLLSGSVPTDVWANITFTADTKLSVNLSQNLLSDVSGVLDVPRNVTLQLQSNPVCTGATQQNISQYCGAVSRDAAMQERLARPESTCPINACPTRNHFQYVPTLPNACFCAAPFGVGIRLRSPSFSNFLPFRSVFETLITSNVYPKPNLALLPYQFFIDSVEWQPGPRLRMFLLFYPQHSNETQTFEASEVQAIANIFATFSLPGNDYFGPYDLLNFTALGPYSSVLLPAISKGSQNKGVLAGIIVGSIACAGVIIVGILLVYRKKHSKIPAKAGKKHSAPKGQVKIDGVQAFTFEDLQMATNDFHMATQIGKGGYGKVFKGTLADYVVAIKRAEQGSLQGEQEFYTEIEMLSRVHHRNLVSLIGYCDEKDEQMLVYEFMPNGSLQDLLAAKYKVPISFGTRLHIALGAARGILYLHTEAEPAIIHRDIKANNILLDSKLTPKVSDFGISRLAPDSDARGNLTAHVSTNVKGTPGYLDPEYVFTHQLTDKSDVYSLGIVFLELLTGMQPIFHGKNIAREAYNACQSGNMFSIIDKSMGQYPSDCVKKFMELALRCSLDETKDRPMMLEVVRILEDIFAILPESDRPALDLNVNVLGYGASSSSISSSAYDRRNTYRTVDLPGSTVELSGSDLVSGIIPSINPR